MAKTWYGVGQWTAAESWRTIRTIRASPPPNLSLVLRGDRATVFHMALEQAQQLYEAAAGCSYETRPLLTFYGLSQAGRALAAASDRLGPRRGGDPFIVWQGMSHGLDYDTNVPNGRTLWSTQVKPAISSKDSFSRVSIALGSPTDLGPVPLGALASQLYDFVLEFPDFGSPIRAWRPEIDLRRYDVGDGLLSLTDYTGKPTIEGVRGYLKAFPALGSTEIIVDDDGVPRCNPQGKPSVIVATEALAKDPLPPEMLSAALYGGSRILLPRLGGASGTVHPLLSWWMLLFSLSMLARYSPRNWRRILELPGNPQASQVEFLQDLALRSVPRLMAEALQELNR